MKTTFSDIVRVYSKEDQRAVKWEVASVREACILQGPTLGNALGVPNLKVLSLYKKREEAMFL